jgi:integrase
MARLMNKLTDVVVKTAQAREKSYKLSDGGGLYLEVMPNGSRYWRLKYRYMGKEDRLALGVYPNVSLAAARKKANKARDDLEQNISPKEVERQHKLAKSIGAANTFEAVALEWLAKETPHWSKSHTVRTNQILQQKLFPWLGNRPIGEITPPELLAALRRTEIKGTLETAKRAQQTSSQVFRYAVATGRADRDPSQDLKGALATPKGKNFAAITDPKEVANLLRAIDHYSGTYVVKTALQLSPLVFLRPSELRTLEWSEIDFDQERIEIPAAKMKMRLPHIVPLAPQSLAILRYIQPITGKGRYVFPSARGASRPLSENGVRTALRSMGFDNETMTPHGFRAMARTILDEVLGVRVEYIEHQLAHAVKDTNGRAYNRTAHLEGRRAMMQQWADYLDKLKAGAEIIPLVSSKKR